MQNTKPGFVHITKTGGASVKRFILLNYKDSFIIDGVDNINLTHSLNTSNFDLPFAIVRDPVDRFFSMYYYWINGSEIFKGDNLNFSLYNFITFLNRKGPELETNHTWNDFFLPQSNWIKNEDYHKTVIIVYKENMSESFLNLINYFNIDYNGHIIEKFNVTKNKKIFNKTIYDFSINLKRFIETKYGEDMELYNNVLNNPQFFKKVIY